MLLLTPRLSLAHLDNKNDTFGQEVDVGIEVNRKSFMVLLRNIVGAFLKDVLVVKQPAFVTSLQGIELNLCL